MSEININYKGSTIASMDSSGTKTLLTSGKYCEDNIAVVYTRPSAPVPALQTKSVAFTPAETIQTSSVTADAGYDGLSAVDISVGAISSTFVGSGIPRKSASDLTQNHQSITAPSGYYSANATFAMAQALGHLTASVDTSGMVTATYDFLTAGYQASGGTAYSMQLTSLAASTYTPSATAQTIPSQRWLAGAQTIEAIPSAYIIPANTSNITSNGVFDIKSFASVDVNVNTGVSYDEVAMRTLSGTASGSATSIGSVAFWFCSAITAADFPEVTVIGNSAFNRCASLSAISFPKATTISAHAFYLCEALTEADLPKATSVGASAFANCASLATVSAPSLTYLGSSAFYNCHALTAASFPKVSTINSNAFYGCSKLTKARFSSAKAVGASAFYSCTSLTSVYFLSTAVATLSNSNAFALTPIANSTYTGSFGSIYVPSSLVASYKVATNWKAYSARITSYGAS